MKKILQLLETRSASVFCLLFAIANRIIFTTLYSQISTDTKIQLTYAQNLLTGKSMGVTKYFTTNLHTPIYDTHLFFPPGFSLAIIPFLKLSGGDEFNAIRIFDITMAILFVITIRILSKRAGLPLALTNIITLIAGCSQYIFFMSWSSTDVVGLCLVLLGLAEVINIVQKKEDLGWPRIIASSLLFCSSFFFRYMYLPIVILFPLLVLFLGIVSARKKTRNAGWKLLGVTVIFLAGLFYFNSVIAGNSLHVNDTGRGFFADQLVHWYPFIPAAFINLDFAAQLLTKITSIGYGRAIYFFEFVNLILFILLIIFLLRFIKTFPKNGPLSPHIILLGGGAAISILILFMLAYLSLTYKELNWGFSTWTYVIDERYFSFLYVFLPLLLFIGIHNYAATLKKRPLRALVFIGLILISIEVMHGVYYNIKIITSHRDLDTIKYADKGYKNFSTVIAELKQKYPGREVLVSSPDQYYLHAASQMGYKTIFDYQNLGKGDLKAPVKSILVVPVHTNETVIIKDYLEKRKPESMTSSDGTFFYFEELDPQ